MKMIEKQIGQTVNETTNNERKCAVMNSNISRTMQGKVVTFVVAAVLALSLVAVAQASVISVDFDLESSNLAATDVAGVVPVSNWNEVIVMTPQSNLKDNTGATTTADFSTSNAIIGGVGSAFPYPGNDYQMMDQALFDNAANTDPAAFETYLSFAQIPYARFDLYLYSSANVTDRTATFRIGSDTEVKGTGNPSTFIQGQNYVLFSGLTASSFDVEARANIGTGFPQIVFNGFQIVAVPEPSTVVLLGVGGLMLWKRVRRA